MNYYKLFSRFNAFAVALIALASVLLLFVCLVSAIFFWFIVMTYYQSYTNVGITMLRLTGIGFTLLILAGYVYFITWAAMQALVKRETEQLTYTNLKNFTLIKPQKKIKKVARGLK